MKARERNPALWERLNDIVASTNKYNLAPHIKKESDILNFIFDETSHFPDSRSISFRARAIAYEQSCECSQCGSIVVSLDKKFCSHKCYTEYKKENIRKETFGEIIERVPRLISFNLDDFPEGTATPDDIDQFVETWNRIRSLKHDDILLEHNDGRLNNAKSKMLAYLAKIVTRNKEVVDYFDHVMKCYEFDNKTENIEWFTLLYGEEYAAEKMKKKSDRVAGDKNPAYQHGGLFSPFSEKFIGEANREDVIRKAHQSREASNGYTVRLSYWTERYGEEEGKKLFYERQRTFSKEKLIEKLGEEEGIRRWEERQRKWQSTLKSLPESEKIRINAEKGFWRYENEHDEMNPEDPKNKEPTILYMIEYLPRGHYSSFIKIGVTSKYLTQRFPAVCIKREILIHSSDRYTNFKIERDVKKSIFNKGMGIVIESNDMKFDGWTECTPVGMEYDVLKIVENAIKENT